MTSLRDLRRMLADLLYPGEPPEVVDHDLVQEVVAAIDLTAGRLLREAGDTARRVESVKGQLRSLLPVCRVCAGTGVLYVPSRAHGDVGVRCPRCDGVGVSSRAILSTVRNAKALVSADEIREGDVERLRRAVEDVTDEDLRRIRNHINSFDRER